MESRLSTDLFRLAIGLLVIMVVSRVHQNFPMLAKMRPALLLVGAAAVYALARPQALANPLVLRRWWSVLVLSIPVQAYLSAPFGISLGNSGKFLLFAYSTVVLLAVLTLLALRQTSDLMSIIAAHLIGIGALAWLSTFVFKLQHGSGLARLSDLYTFDANDVGLVLVTALPIAVAMVPVWRGRARPIMLALPVLIGVAIARTGSRGAFLALLVTGLGMLVLTRGVSLARKAVVVLAVAIGIGVAAPPGYMDQMRTMLRPKEDYNWSSPTGRREVTKRGIGYMMAYPVFGVGINNFSKAECTISPRIGQELGVGIRCTAPHNTWIQVGAELGFPGLVLWILLLTIPFFKLLALGRRLPVAWARGDQEQRFLFGAVNALPVSLLGFMVASSFLSFAWLDLPYLLVIYAGTAWILATKRLTGEAAVTPTPRRAAAQPGPGVRRRRARG